MKSQILTAALFGALSATAAIAQDEPIEPAANDVGVEHHRPYHKGMRGHKGMHQEHMLKKADSNGDGQVDLTEFLRNAEERFASMDQNSDGYVTPEEMQQTHKDMRKRHHQAMKEARKAYKESSKDSE